MSDATTRPFVVIPCLNEEKAIGRLLAGVLAHCPDVVVIDDGSTDGTADIVAALPVTLIRHETRRGKGDALRAGFRKALELGASGVLTMDGDGQHDPADIPRMLAAARQFPDALVVGARMLGKERQPNARRRANDFADWGISWGCGRPVADTQSGQRWYPRATVELVDPGSGPGQALPAQDFVFEAAILIAASRDLDMPVVSIPIDCRYDHEARHSHFRPVRDVMRITWYTIQRILHYGSVVRSYRASHTPEPLVFDPDHRLTATRPVSLRRVGSPPPAEG
ncbi:MAG TPA: glycosyltransferase family 2 protein [Rhodanobacteraceae bacterium]|nr:glycosyltransferase family 2 protein [Rhodanobacteraceae bacterium]